MHCRVGLVGLALFLAFGCGGNVRREDAASFESRSGLTFVQRKAALDATAANLRQQIQRKVADPWSATAAFMRTRPEFSVVVASPTTKSISAQFRDGRWVSVSGNRFRDERPRRDFELEPSSLAGRSAVPALPGINKAAFVVSDDGAFQVSQVYSSQRASMFTRAGYTTTFRSRVTLANLRAANGHGFVYIGTHGVLINVAPTKRMLCLAIDQTVDAASDATFAPLLAGTLPQMGYMVTLDRVAPDGTPFTQTQYGITHRWIEANMNLRGMRSVVVLDACETGTPLGAPLRTALFNVGADTVFAWNGSTSSTSRRAIDMLIDRSLGDNTVQKINPDQRAHLITDVYAELVRRGLHVDENNARVSLSMFRKAGATVGLLRPTIRRLQFDLGDILLIQGQFGPQPANAKVTVGGAVQEIKRWTPTEIRVQLPPKDCYGDVVVHSGPFRSLPRVLTEWTGQMTVKNEPLDRVPLREIWTMNLVLRGDAYPWRNKVDETPVKTDPADPFNLIAATGSTSRYQASGYWVNPSDPDDWTRWTADTPIGFIRAPMVPNPQISSFGRVNLQTNSLEFVTLIGGTMPNIQLKTVTGPGFTFKAAPMQAHPLFWNTTVNAFGSQVRLRSVPLLANHNTSPVNWVRLDSELKSSVTISALTARPAKSDKAIASEP